MPTSADELSEFLHFLAECERNKAAMDREYDAVVAHYDLAEDFDIRIPDMQVGRRGAGGGTRCQGHAGAPVGVGAGTRYPRTCRWGSCGGGGRDTVPDMQAGRWGLRHAHEKGEEGLRRE